MACEITARTGKDPGEHYDALVAEFGPSWYARHDQPGTPEEKAKIATFSSKSLPIKELCNEKVLSAFTEAPGNGASIGGIKVTAEHGWFAMRPSGTENVVKIYAESTLSAKHLEQIFAEAEALLKV